MNDLKVFVVASTGTLATQLAQGGLPDVSGGGIGEIVVKMLVSVVGGIVSTFAYKLINRKLGQLGVFGKRDRGNNETTKN